MSRNQSLTARAALRSPEQAALERYASGREATDPAERMAGLVADAELRAPLSMGQQRQFVEQLRAAGAELIDHQPYRRRHIEDLLDLLETTPISVAVLYDKAITAEPEPLGAVLRLVHRLDEEDEEDEEVAA